MRSLLVHRYPPKPQNATTSRYPELLAKTGLPSCARSGARLLDDQMGGAGGWNDAAAQHLGNHARGFAGTVDALVGQLIGGDTLRIERTKAGFVAEQRASSHGHAAGQQNLDRRIEPKDGDPGVTQEFRAASLCVGAAAEG